LFKPRRQTAEATRTASPIAQSGKPAAHSDDEALVGGSGDEMAIAAVAKAEAAFSDGHLAGARILATEAVTAARRASPALKVRAFVIMGKVELASEEFAEAERTFERALAIAPNHPVARKGKDRAREAAAKAAQP
jgi:Tfp pilus assembly protein PilF